MASPHVAGVAALVAQANPGASPAAVGSFILSHATPNLLGSIGTGSPNLLLYSLAGGTATQPPTAVIAVQALSGTGTKNGRNWRANATTTVRDVNSGALMANVTVSGSFAPGGSGTCVTAATGMCTITSGAISRSTPSTVFSVTGLAGANMSYDRTQNSATQVPISAP